MRSLSPLSRRILKKAGIAAAFFCSAFLFGSVLSHFTCRALRKAAPVFLSAAPETPVSSVSMPVLSSAAENWGLSFPEKGKTPVGNATSEELAAYNAWFAASPEENIIYLTFDCGYENGNTPAILDALQKHQAPAAFFVVGNFLSDQPDLVKRMAAEGHIVGNHTWSHPDMSKISTQEAFSEELNRVSTLYQEILILGATGGRIDHLWANVQSLAIPFKAGIDAVIMDTQNKIRLIGGGETHLKKGETYGPYFSVFPLGEEVYGFSIKGAKYPLDNHTLIPYDSLCVSNQFQEDEVTISFMKGIVILMETKDR